jgi:allantoinase
MSTDDPAETPDMDTDDLVVTGGTVVTPAGPTRADVHITGGRITGIGTGPAAGARVIPAEGLLVLPGMVDTHIHLMDPGDTAREDFPTGTAAAAARGVTTIVEHTHVHPIREAADLHGKRAHLRDRAHVDYGLAAHVWPDRLDRIPELWRAGVVFFKIFTCTTHGVPGLNPADLRDALSAIAAVDGRALVHCEDESLTARDERRLRDSGRTDGAVISQWRSPEAELVAVATVAELAHHTGARVTVAHVSSPAVAEVIAAARQRGADLAAEACPQYFLLREQELATKHAFRKFTPPARARTDADEQAMWALLRSGALSHVSSDHAPATVGQKTAGTIWDVHFGLPGLDTTLPLLLDAALRDRISLAELARVYAEAPARRYGLHPRKGQIAAGADADLVLVDPEGEHVLRDEDILSRAGWTPYAGRRVRGTHVATLLRGRVIAERGIPTRTFDGRFLPGPGAR